MKPIFLYFSKVKYPFLFGFCVFFLSISLNFAQETEEELLTEEIIEPKEISQAKKVASFEYLGVLSQALDSLSRNMLATQLYQMLSQDPDFTNQSLLGLSHKANEKYQRSLNSFEFLKKTLPELNQTLIFLTFERVKNLYRCNVYIVNTLTDTLRAATQVYFSSDIKNQIRMAASHMYKSIRHYYGLSIAEPKARTLYKLKTPIVNALLTYQHKILEFDSITHIQSGQTLILSPQAQPYTIRSQNFRYLLHPASAYTFHNASLIEVNQGRFSSVQINYPVKIISTHLICASSSLLADIEVTPHKSMLNLFAGEAQVSVMNQPTEPQPIKGKQRVHSSGFSMLTSTIPDSLFSLELQKFKPLLNSRIIQHFRSSKQILDILPSRSIDFFRADVQDPMYYFMASELNELGIPMEALSFEGESWDIDKSLFKSGIHETGCFLCSPNHLDLD